MMRWLDAITDSVDMRSEQTPGVGDGQGGLMCCSPWGHKELDTTEQLNSTELICKKNILILWSIQHLGHLSDSIK